MKTILTNAELISELINMINTYPNDQELGKKIRLYINDYIDNKNIKDNLYIDNSHEKGY